MNDHRTHTTYVYAQTQIQIYNFANTHTNAY